MACLSKSNQNQKVKLNSVTRYFGVYQIYRNQTLGETHVNVEIQLENLFHTIRWYSDFGLLGQYQYVYTFEGFWVFNHFPSNWIARYCAWAKHIRQTMD